MRRINYPSRTCRSALHATCPYLLNIRGSRVAWCSCVCHHEPIQSRIRADRATRGLFERDLGAPAAAGISVAEEPAPLAESARAQPAPAVPVGVTDQVDELDT